MAQYKMDEVVRSAWNERVENGRQQPWLSSIWMQYGDSLLTRFQHQYQSLRSLPRRVRRMLKSKFSLSLGKLALVLALTVVPADLTIRNAVISGDSQSVPVHSLSEANDGNALQLIQSATIIVNGNNPAVDCTLDDAIIAANTNTATGNCIAGTGDDIIDIQVNVNLTAPAPVISSKMTLEGNGNSIAGDDTFGPLLSVNGSGDMTLKNATVSHGFYAGSGGSRYGGGISIIQGSAVISGTTLSNNSSPYGGGIFVNVGSAVIRGSTISYNSAGINGGGLTIWGGSTAISETKFLNNNAGGGGGIFNGGSMTIMESTLSGNSANSGGGIFNYDGFLQLLDSTISGNSAGGGGGITNFWYISNLSIENSTISNNNTTSAGAGIRNQFGADLTINNSTISSNISSGNYGGGISAHSDNGYAAIITINDSTITGNASNSPGGGVWIQKGQVSINRSLITNNSGSGVANDVYNADILTADNYNLFGHDGLTTAESIGGFTPGVTDILATSDGSLPTPLNNILDTFLQNNGGGTDTHALALMSPAIDGVVDGGCAAGMEDQRHLPRASGQGMGGPLCDIGAYELQITSSIYFPVVLNTDVTTHNTPRNSSVKSGESFLAKRFFLGWLLVMPLGLLKQKIFRNTAVHNRKPTKFRIERFQ